MIILFAVEKQFTTIEADDTVDKLEIRVQNLYFVEKILPDEPEKVVWLTFDDGPSKNTEAILDILDKYDVKATFFVTGENPNYFYLIKEAYERGHAIGLHTYSHNYKEIYDSEGAYYADLYKIGEVVEQQIGFVPTIIRFPGGSSNTISNNYCKGIMSLLTKNVLEMGYRYFDWNGSNGDGYTARYTKTLIKTLKKTVGNKQYVMLLFHDGNQSKKTVASLEESIVYLLEEGYVFKTIDEDTDGFHHRVNN